MLATKAREPVDGQGLIHTWGPIAQYLGTSVSTARRWANYYGLPVGHTPAGRVFTSKSMIDQWILAKAKLRWAMLAEAKAERDTKRDNQGVTADTSTDAGSGPSDPA